MKPVPGVEGLYYSIPEKKPLQRGREVFYKAPAVILAVDDNPTDLSRMEKLLTSSGFTVTTATNGQLALDAVKRSRLQWTCVRLMFSPDAEMARAFLDEIERQDIRWNECNPMPVNPNLSVSAAGW